MAEVRRNHTTPPPPPDTYDLLGLTENELALIRDLVGVVYPKDTKELYNGLSPHPLYRAILEVLPDPYTSNSITMQDFQRSLALARIAHPYWRLGQAQFNTLLFVAPEWAEEIRGTKLDPFYVAKPGFMPWLANKIEQLNKEVR